jgi:hypothetical protein
MARTDITPNVPNNPTWAFSGPNNQEIISLTFFVNQELIQRQSASDSALIPQGCLVRRFSGGFGIPSGADM